MLECPLNPPILGDFEYTLSPKLAGATGAEGEEEELGGRSSTFARGLMISRHSCLIEYDLELCHWHPLSQKALMIFRFDAAIEASDCIVLSVWQQSHQCPRVILLIPDAIALGTAKLIAFSRRTLHRCARVRFYNPTTASMLQDRVNL